MLPAKKLFRLLFYYRRTLRITQVCQFRVTLMFRNSEKELNIGDFSSCPFLGNLHATDTCCANKNLLDWSLQFIQSA